MHGAFNRIELGLAVAMVVVYMLMVVNFQSWGDPFVVILALPIAFCGILASLFITQTTLSIPSFFGAIMSSSPSHGSIAKRAGAAPPKPPSRRAKRG